jgi:hypothetical protein
VARKLLGAPPCPATCGQCVTTSSSTVTYSQPNCYSTQADGATKPYYPLTWSTAPGTGGQCATWCGAVSNCPDNGRVRTTCRASNRDTCQRRFRRWRHGVRRALDCAEQGMDYHEQ